MDDTPTGKIMTVAGPIDPDDLGTTIMHEHLFIALTKQVAPDERSPASDVALWREKLTLENLHLARTRRSIFDNWILSDEDLAIREAMEFRKMGGDSIVEMTSTGIHRDPEGLLRVSRATGLNIVMGSGWYQKAYHPPDMDELTVEDMGEEIVRDINIGVRDTGIRSGVIGEVGVQGRAHRAQRGEEHPRVGPRQPCDGRGDLLPPREGRGREKFQTLAIMDEEGVDRSRVIYGHSDSSAGDIPLLLELLEEGVYIQFDLMGRVGVPIDLGPSDGGVGLTLPLTAMVAAAIPQLIGAGHVDQILLSQDVCTKVQLKAYGGTGYSYILETFLPHLRSRGVSDENIRKMMVENPKRVLTLAEPAA